MGRQRMRSRGSRGESKLGRHKGDGQEDGVCKPWLESLCGSSARNTRGRGDAGDVGKREPDGPLHRSPHEWDDDRDTGKY